MPLPTRISPETSRTLATQFHTNYSDGPAVCRFSNASADNQRVARSRMKSVLRRVTDIYDAATPNGFPGIRFNNGGDRRKVIEVRSWGDGMWANMQGSFFGCTALTKLPDNGAQARTEKVQNWAQFLTGCSSLVEFPWMDLSGATATNSFFNGCSSLTTVAEGLETGNSTTFTFFFVGCSSLTSVPWFDTSKGTLFTSFIDGCPLLTSLPAYDMGNGTGFLNFARNCTGLIGKPFPLLNLRKATTAQQFMQNSGMDTASWDSYLIDLAANAVNNNVLLHGGNSKYSPAAAAARLHLTTPVGSGGRGWTIVDGGPV